MLNPTLNFQAGNIADLPIILNSDGKKIIQIVEKIIQKAKFDWDSYETSWDFEALPLLSSEYRSATLHHIGSGHRSHTDDLRAQH